MTDEEDTTTIEDNEHNGDTHAEDCKYEMDKDHEAYLQDTFQDEIVSDIYENLVIYIRNHALPMCEYMTQDDVENIIDELQA